jgi:predicted amidohydrolase YtcJ
VHTQPGHSSSKSSPLILLPQTNQLSNGGRIALGSDFPVESIDPLKGFYAAVSRLSESGDSPHGQQGWYSDMKLTREEALRGMTVDGESSR